MHIGVPDGGVRARVLADVLRRWAELRGATAWVVAPAAADLTGLNVAPPALESGPVDVVVEAAATVGVVEVDDLGVRLVLLATPSQDRAVLTRAALEAARNRLDRWRGLVARWAESPSAPMVESYVRRAFAALNAFLDTPTVVALLDELADDDAVPPGSRFETAAYLDRLLALDLVADVGRSPRPPSRV